MKKTFGALSDERGFAIVGALLVLALVTIIGAAAISTSTSERRTATNYLIYERVFYTAEAGLAHVKEAFKNTLRADGRLSVMAITGKPDWNFALHGATVAAPEKTWIANQPLGGNTYTITVWDNDDDGDPASDSDGLIWIRSEAVGPQRGISRIETLATATATSDPIHGYNAQEGGGSGKNFTSNDANRIDFVTPGVVSAQPLHVGG
jgi:type II secretory pathway pseudopilin PulG